MTQQSKYHAFISYRHADNKIQGRQWATWLHQAIETYEVPDELVGKKNSSGEIIPSSIYPIFRDEEELPAHADLGHSIVSALDSTRLLIVLCSPNAVASTYVADEIDYFKRQGGSDRIIAAMIDGEPNTSWDKGKQSAGFSIETECFPTPLQFEYDIKGVRTEKHAEPIAADFRINNNGQPEQGWTSPEAYRQHLINTSILSHEDIQKKINQYEKQQHLMLLKIIAGILGLPLGELTQRDKEYQLEQERLKAKKLRRWLSAVAVLSIISISAGTFAFFKQQEAVKSEQIARKERDKAVNTQSNLLMSMAKIGNDSGQHDTALLLGLNAMPGIYGGERPLLPISYELRKALIQNQKLAEFSHQHKINATKLSQDGKLLATASWDKTAVLWSAISGQKLHTLNHDKSVQHVSFSQDGKFLLTASLNGTAILWSTDKGKKLHTFIQKSIKSEPRFSPNGKTLLTTSGNTSTLWSTESGKRLFSFQHNNTSMRTRFISDGRKIIDKNIITHTSFSPDGQTLLTASNDKTAILWSTKNGERLNTLKHPYAVTLTAFSPNGQNYVTTSRSKTANLWTKKSGMLQQIKLHHDKAIEYVTFSPDGKSLLTTSSDNIAVLWSTINGEKLYSFKHSDVINHASFSPDGKSIVTASWDNTVSHWSADNGKKLQTFKLKNAVNYAAFDHTGNKLLTSSDDNVATLWSMSNGEKLQTLKNTDIPEDSIFSPDGKFLLTKINNISELWSVDSGEKLYTFKHKDDVSHASFSSDGKLLVTISYKTATFWLLDSGEKLKSLQHNAPLQYTVFSPDNKTLLTNSNNNSILWSVSDAKKIKTLRHKRTVEYGSFSPDGKTMLTSTADNRATIWNVASGKKLQSLLFENELSSRASYSNDGTTLAIIPRTIRNHSVKLWSIDKQQKILDLPHKDTIEHASFSPDGKLLITASNETVLWSVISGKKLMTLPHKMPATYASFSPNGKTILTSSIDNTAVLWSTESGEKLRTLQVENITKAIFNPNGESLLTVSNYESTTLWKLHPKDIIKTAISKLPANRTCLKPEERKKFFLSKLTSNEWIARGCSQHIQNLN